MFTHSNFGKLGAALCFSLPKFHRGLLLGSNALAFLSDQFLLHLLLASPLLRFCPGSFNFLSTLALQSNRLRIEQVAAILDGKVRMPQCR